MYIPILFPNTLLQNGKDKNYLSVVSTRDKANVLSLFNEYITYGAFPELVEIKTKETSLAAFIRQYTLAISLPEITLPILLPLK